MEGWDKTIDSIVIGNDTYTGNNWQQMPDQDTINVHFPWSIIYERDGGTHVEYFTSEENLIKWLNEHGFDKLAKAFKDAMHIRRKLIEMINNGCLANEKLMRWFCEVQTLGGHANHGCHYIFDHSRNVAAPPNPVPPQKFLHINNGGSIPDFRPLDSGYWWHNKLALQVCAGTCGAILYMGTNFQGSARLFAGAPGAPMIYNGLGTFKDALSVQDLGQC
jgi:hypothetical protein